MTSQAKKAIYTELLELGAQRIGDTAGHHALFHNTEAGEWLVVVMDGNGNVEIKLAECAPDASNYDRKADYESR